MTFLKSIVPGTVWASTTPFKLFGLVPTNNNGLIVKTKQVNQQNVLVAVNCPKLASQRDIDEIRALEVSENCKLMWIIATDWHHLFAPQWTEAFPQATVVFPAQRGVRKHETEKFHKQVLDREHPQITDLDPNLFRLIPVLGFEGVFYKQEDERMRGDYVVYLPQTKLLFVFDLLLGRMPPAWYQCWKSRKPTDLPPLPRKNFTTKGSWGIPKGFKALDTNRCRTTVQNLLALDVDICVFAHGDLEVGGALLQTKELSARALNELRELI